MLILLNREQREKPNGEKNFCPTFVVGVRSRNIFKRFFRWIKIRLRIMK
jgi:hypothetical protein